MNWFKRAAYIGVLSLGTATAAIAAPISTGDVFAAVNSGRVFQYTNGGTFIQQLNTGQGGFTTGMAFDSNKNLNVTNFSAGTITRFAPDATVLPPNPYVTPSASPESIAFSSSGLMYVGRAAGQAQ